MVTSNQLAKILKISDRRVRALIADGRIKAQKMGKTWVILDYSDAIERKPGKPIKA